MRLKVYFGKVCAKHPELKGERRLYNRNCVACKREADLRYQEKNREAVLLRKRKWYEENREAIQAYMRIWYEENREVAQAYKRKWHEENREAVLLRKRKYSEENREAVLLRKRKWYEENRERRLTYYREHNAAFKAKHGVCSSTYYRRLKKEQKCAVN